MNDKCENCKSCLFYCADADDIGTCEITDNIVDAGQDACNATEAKKMAAMSKLFTEYLKGGYDDICDYPMYRRARLKGMNHIKRIYYKLISRL